MTKKVLVTGAIGQIGSELVAALKERYGAENVVSSDVRIPASLGEFAPFEVLDVLDYGQIESLVKKHSITVIYHLAALLSATGEKNPQLCWKINVDGLYNILEVARNNNVKQVICPSTIAVFGPKTPRENTPQETILEPSTMYGITKVAGELLCSYYVNKFGLDVRGIRYPGLISWKTPAGGGTTDYAVEIFYEAIQNKKYTCFLRSDTVLPMMYMPDAIRGTIDLAEADFAKLKHHANFNFAAMSFSCEELAAEIKKHIPDFEISYQPDFRQNIADSWPTSVDDSAAKSEWSWKPQYDLVKMTKDMILNLRKKFS